MKKVLAFLSIAFLSTSILTAEDSRGTTSPSGGGSHGTGRATSSRGYGNGGGYSRSYGRGTSSYRPSSRSFGGAHYGGNGSYSSGGGRYYGQNPSSTVGGYGNSGRYGGGMGNSSSPYIAYGRQMLPKSLQHSSPRLPAQGPRGGSVASRAVSPQKMSSALVRGPMSKVVNSSGFSRRVYTYNATESRAGHYYWHSLNGLNFCHYCDRWGCNWYGWNAGGAFFWTQFYWGNWWWCNPADGYWCYWYNNNWWWQDPQTETAYLYNNGNYVPQDEADQYTENTNPGPGDDNSGSPMGGYGSQSQDKPVIHDEPIVYKSPDGSVIVHLEGDSRDAFLYKTVGDGTAKPVYLSSGVSDVMYSKNGGELRILLILNDGSFDVFNADGTPLESKPPAGGGKTAGYES